MSLLLHLTPTEEARVSDAAHREGLEPEEVVRKLILNHLPGPESIEEMKRRIRLWQEQDRTLSPSRISVPSNTTPTAALFDQWAAEDAAMSDDEAAEDIRLWQDVQDSINQERERSGMRRLF